MATSKDYLQYLMEQVSPVGGITYRPMMGEYVLYYKGKVIGGIYDNRVLIKITPASLAFLPDAPREIPYDGAKEMLLLDFEGREDLRELLDDLYDSLPAPKQKKSKKEANSFDKT